jgi:EAL domain-containing protein (putative c-di-GMP-specific phosphodiesterase class I)
MRTWEIEDGKNLMADLVREQDFILRVRRMQRLGTPHLVINLVLSAIDKFVLHQGALEAVQHQLQEFTKVTHGIYAEMANGDVFIAWEEKADTQTLPTRLITAILSEVEEKDIPRFLLTWRMPKDYTALRERTNYYVELANANTTLNATPAQMLKSDAVRGELTAWSVDQIGKLLNEIDLRHYARTQPIYKLGPDKIWQPVAEEYFISFDDLRRERFPKIELITPEHLFLALCQMLDQRLLAQLIERPDTIADRALHLNLSVRSIMGAAFAAFTHSLTPAHRKLVGFEIHRGDVFQDFSLTLAAIETLHKEGFTVAIDSVTPDMLEYLNMEYFSVDQIKINVSKDRAALLDQPNVQKALAKIPSQKLVFFRCDNERALAIGQKLGVTQFQGWLIDDAVRMQQKT